MNILKACSIFIMTTIVGCYSTIETSLVSDIIGDRERHFGQELAVVGTLSITSSSVLLCDIKSTETCMNLAIPADIFEYAKKLNFKQVLIHGVYLDHEYKNLRGEILFLPSRIVVHRIAAQ